MVTGKTGTDERRSPVPHDRVALGVPREMDLPLHRKCSSLVQQGEVLVALLVV